MVFRDKAKDGTTRLTGNPALAAYPVGAVYESSTDVNPGTFLGGTWVADDFNQYVTMVGGVRTLKTSYYLNGAAKALAAGWNMDNRGGRAYVAPDTSGGGFVALGADFGINFLVPGNYQIGVTERFSIATSTNTIVSLSKSPTVNPDSNTPYLRMDERELAIMAGSFNVNMLAGESLYVWVYTSTACDLVASTGPSHSVRTITRMGDMPTTYKYVRTA